MGASYNTLNHEVIEQLLDGRNGRDIVEYGIYSGFLAHHNNAAEHSTNIHPSRSRFQRMGWNFQHRLTGGIVLLVTPSPR